MRKALFDKEAIGRGVSVEATQGVFAPDAKFVGRTFVEPRVSVEAGKSSDVPGAGEVAPVVDVVGGELAKPRASVEPQKSK
eukprot:CAMPEP_0198519304 /NCGR_PEP_ID=MMETSP1462-20131121/19638_1 /TAXON_ID=1333877 /ORGANISM="Brandtodinium nutriculum, Strain RCC3387" /LENGTH=80 /DNA_ID=CAMNT_0044248915 /DNA_START=182 /DNA_END=424 /DNA_ORIENTATION=-